MGSLFVASFILHALFGWWQYVADQAAAGAAASIWGWDGYVVYFAEWTFQNWQSEFLEVLLLIVLTASLIHRGSHESKDGEDEMKAALGRIERRLDAMGAPGSRAERDTVPAAPRPSVLEVVVDAGDPDEERHPGLGAERRDQ